MAVFFFLFVIAKEENINPTADGYHMPITKHHLKNTNLVDNTNKRKVKYGLSFRA